MDLTRRAHLQLVACAVAFAAVSGDQPQVRIVLEDQRTGDVLTHFTAHQGSTVELSWIHSVEHALWREFYEILGDGFLLDCTEPGSFGAGTPSNAPRTETVDGRVRFCGLGRRFERVSWIHSHAVQHRVTMNDDVMVDTTSLPHHTFISMRVSRRVIET